MDVLIEANIEQLIHLVVAALQLDHDRIAKLLTLNRLRRRSAASGGRFRPVLVRARSGSVVPNGQTLPTQ